MLPQDVRTESLIKKKAVQVGRYSGGSQKMFAMPSIPNDLIYVKLVVAACRWVNATRRDPV